MARHRKDRGQVSLEQLDSNRQITTCLERSMQKSWGKQHTLDFFSKFAKGSLHGLKSSRVIPGKLLKTISMFVSHVRPIKSGSLKVRPNHQYI